MSVILRKRINKGGSVSIYLDIHHNGKRFTEYFPELKLVDPAIASPLDRIQNKEKYNLALQIKNKKALELEGQDYDVLPSFKRKIDFIAYFQAYIDKYPNKDKRVIVSTFSRFKKFLEKAKIKDLTSDMVNESLVEDFKNHLEENLNGESPSNYFKKFKKLLNQATRDKIFRVNPSLDIKIKRKDSIQKDTLTMSEIQKLVDTPVTNSQMGRAFIFCCYTAVRWCDLRRLKWKNVNLNEKTLSFTQSKTGIKVDIILHEAALQMIGVPGEFDQLIFNLPSHTAALKGLRYWTKKAGIQKHITWHCARHSFATNMLFHGGAGLVVSRLLGHSNMTYTQRYVRIVDSMKQDAIANLPGLISK